MRAEKKYLIQEVETHLKKSDYVIVTNFTKATVSDIADLRVKLAPFKAEFHVVKNSSLKVAAKSLGLPPLDASLAGPSAIIVGGKDSPAVAKLLLAYFKDKQKFEVKVGVLSKSLINPKQVEQLADMPPMSVLRAKMLGLLQQPGSSLVRILNGVPVSLVNVLNAKAKPVEAAS